MNMDQGLPWRCIIAPEKVVCFVNQGGEQAWWLQCIRVRQVSVHKKVMLMVRAGQSVDEYIEVLPSWAGDIIIDGGNTFS